LFRCQFVLAQFVGGVAVGLKVGESVLEAMLEAGGRAYLPAIIGAASRDDGPFSLLGVKRRCDADHGPQQAECEADKKAMRKDHRVVFNWLLFVG
jgi:hypothetical protein